MKCQECVQSFKKEHRCRDMKTDNPMFNPEVRKKHLNICRSEEHKQKLRKPNPKQSETKKRLFKEGILKPWNKDLTKETDERLEKLGKIRRGKRLEEIFGKEKANKMKEEMRKSKFYMFRNSLRKGIPPWNKGLTKGTDERVRKYGESGGLKRKGKLNPKNSETRKKLFKEGKMNSPMKNKHHRENSKIILKEKQLSLWKNSTYRENQIKSIIKANLKRPTSFEKKIIYLCKKYDLPFDYVGDGKVIINYVNPDFINNNGKKQIIEVYHKYFKERDFGSCENYEKQRSERFAKFGFKTLFLRNEDILRKDWEQNCLDKINNF